MTTLIAKNPDTGDQTTYYVYGVSADDGSDLATSGLLRATIYPDSADGADQVSIVREISVGGLRQFV